MNADDSADDREEIHRGHDLEAGLISRVREWTDIFPWIRLGRTLRVAGSPPLLMLVAVTVAVWWFGSRLIFGEDSFTQSYPALTSESEGSVDVSRQGAMLAVYFRGLIPSVIFDIGTGSVRWGELLNIIWSLLVWTPTALILARQGALLTAGRTLVGLKPGLAHAFRRTPAAWLAAIVPVACVIAVGLMIFVVGLASKVVGGVPALDAIFAVAVAFVAIPCGILAFGASIAVPLSWAALVNEQDPDTLDSLSRGYEYCFRRPLQLALYGLVALAVLWVAGFLAWGVAWAASSVASGMLGMSGSSAGVPRLAVAMLQQLPAVVVLTLTWSLIGGVYLLIRCDAGGQEVEDLWQPAPPTRPTFPNLPEAVA